MDQFTHNQLLELRLHQEEQVAKAKADVKAAEQALAINKAEIERLGQEQKKILDKITKLTRVRTYAQHCLTTLEAQANQVYKQAAKAPVKVLCEHCGGSVYNIREHYHDFDQGGYWTCR